LGTGNEQSPLKFHQLPDVTMVDGGLNHVVALKKDGSVWAAGYNQMGELGDGTKTKRRTFVKVIDSGVVHVDAGYISCRVIKEDGSLWAVGDNRYGEFGDGTKTQTPILNYVKVLDGGVVDVNSGFFTTMVIKQDGSLWATGYNNYGQLGDGTKVDKKVFVKVIDAGVRVVEPSGHFCHVLKDDGSVWATGWNRHSQLGDGTKTDKHTFVKVISSGVKRIATGADQFYAIKQDGSLWGVGYNHWGQLGNGKTTKPSTGATTSTDFNKITDMVVKEVGSGHNHGVLLNDKNQLCGTGYNIYNQLGNGDTKNVIGFDKDCYARPGGG